MTEVASTLPTASAHLEVAPAPVPLCPGPCQLVYANSVLCGGCLEPFDISLTTEGTGDWGWPLGWSAMTM